MDGSIVLSGFFRCACGKLHTYGGISRNSFCPECGRELWVQATTVDSVSPREFHSIREAARVIAEELPR